MTMSTDPDDLNSYQPAAREKKRREALQEANAAFAARMMRAIKRGREHAIPGIHVDLSPATFAIRLRGELQHSAGGSPGAMCADAFVPSRSLK